MSKTTIHFEHNSSFNKVIKGENIESWQLYSKANDKGYSKQTSLNFVKHYYTAKQFEMFLKRKRKHLQSEAFASIRLVYMIKLKNKTLMQNFIDVLGDNLKHKASTGFNRWKDVTTKIAKRQAKGMNLLRKVVETRQTEYIKTGLSKLHSYVHSVLKVLEKIERKYLLQHHCLLDNILNLESSQTTERITVQPAPTKFSRPLIIKKNAYKYLCLLLRKLTNKRTELLFKWYQHHTLNMRYSCYLTRILERRLKLRS